MLVKLTLQMQIQKALMNAFDKAVGVGNKATKDVKVTQQQIATEFAKCAQEIASAIDAFVRSGTVHTTVTVVGYGGIYTGTGIGSVS